MDKGYERLVAAREADVMEVFSGFALSEQQVLERYGNMLNLVSLHGKITPVHEAGHAVALALSGRRVKQLKVWGWPARGIVTPETSHGGRRTPIDDFMRQHGPHGLLRDTVMSLAGPAAEMRFDDALWPMRGWHDDYFKQSMNVAGWMQDRHGVPAGGWLSAAWREACRIMLDERAWAAAMDIASVVQNSTAVITRVQGSRIQKIVDKHLPEGWAWEGSCLESAWEVEYPDDEMQAAE